MSDPIVKLIPITDIFIDDDFNCRGRLTPFDVQDLAKDIDAHGLHQPVVVMACNESELVSTKCQYRLLAGFRRTYAHKILNRESVLALIKDHMSGSNALLLNLSENLKRRDLNLMQEAKAIAKLKAIGVPQEEIATLVGKSRGWVQTRFALLDLPTEIQVEAAAGMITHYHIKALAGLKTDEARYDMVKKIKDRKLKGEQTSDLMPRKKLKPTARKKRKPAELSDMIDTIMDQIGGNLATRALAWANGSISDLEFYSSLREHDATFKIPELQFK